MNRSARLRSAKTWIASYAGKHPLRGYCNHFGVDWECAAIELKLSGIEVDPAYLAARKCQEVELAGRRKANKEANSLQNEHWHPYTDTFSAYLAEDFAALHDLEMREWYGNDREYHEIGNRPGRDGTADSDYLQDIESLQTDGKPGLPKNQ